MHYVCVPFLSTNNNCSLYIIYLTRINVTCIQWWLLNKKMSRENSPVTMWYKIYFNRFSLYEVLKFPCMRGFLALQYMSSCLHINSFILWISKLFFLYGASRAEKINVIRIGIFWGFFMFCFDLNFSIFLCVCLMESFTIFF